MVTRSMPRSGVTDSRPHRFVITIFEPLGREVLVEDCLALIGAPPHPESMPIGKAVRGARLNPETG